MATVSFFLTTTTHGKAERACMATYLGSDNLSPNLQRSSGLLVWIWWGVVGTVVPVVMHGGYHPPVLLCEAGVVIEGASYLLLS